MERNNEQEKRNGEDVYRFHCGADSTLLRSGGSSPKRLATRRRSTPAVRSRWIVADFWSYLQLCRRNKYASRGLYRWVCDNSATQPDTVRRGRSRIPVLLKRH